jgi:hypothetical protein
MRDLDVRQRMASPASARKKKNQACHL